MAISVLALSLGTEDHLEGGVEEGGEEILAHVLGVGFHKERFVGRRSNFARLIRAE